MINSKEQRYKLKHTGHSVVTCNETHLKDKSWYANSWVHYLGSLSENACAADTIVLISSVTHPGPAKTSSFT